MKRTRIKVYVGIGGIWLFLACTTSVQNWKIKRTIDLHEITPIGIAMTQDTIWIADGDHHRLVHINTEGKVIQSFEDFNRPMHIDAKKGSVYIPEYGADQISVLKNSKRSTIAIPKTIDAPTGISVVDEKIAVTDFYHHQIHLFDQNKWTTFGTKGHHRGQLYYPTDVHLVGDKIYVADAYNNRVQVFNVQGNVVQVIGEAEGIKGATGIFATKDQIFVTDYEQHRVLVYLPDGTLHQVLTLEIQQPTDVFYINGELWITNYGSKSITVYQAM